jgi:hypothetical protein
MLQRLDKHESTEKEVNRHICELCGLSLAEIKFVETYSNSI